MSTSAAIQQQIAQLANDLNRQIAVQNQFQKTGGKAIQGAYKDLGKQLTGAFRETEADVNRGELGIGKAYDESYAHIDNAEATLREMLEGLAPTNYGPLAELTRLKAEQKGSDADSLASYKILGTGYTTAARNAISDAAKEGTGAIRDLQSQVAAEGAELNRAYLKEKAAMQVQYASVLAEEQYRREQMALERQRLAAENAARAAASQAQKTQYRGREGLMEWAMANGIKPNELNSILAAINRANVTGDASSAYGYVNKLASNKPKNALLYKKDQVPGQKGVLKAQPKVNLDLLNTGLDIYYGNYASYAG